MFHNDTHLLYRFDSKQVGQAKSQNERSQFEKGERAMKKGTMRTIGIVLLALGIACGGGAGFFFYKAKKAEKLADKYMGKRAGALIVPIMTRKAEKRTNLAIILAILAGVLLIPGGILFGKGKESQPRGGQSARYVPSAYTSSFTGDVSFTKEQLSIYGEYELSTLEGILQKADRGQADTDDLQVIANTIARKIGYEGPVLQADPFHFLRLFYQEQRAFFEARQPARSSVKVNNA